MDQSLGLRDLADFEQAMRVCVCVRSVRFTLTPTFLRELATYLAGGAGSIEGTCANEDALFAGEIQRVAVGRTCS